MKSISITLPKFLSRISCITLVLAATQAARATLVHEYSFNGNPGDTAVTDSVGGANGTLINGSSTAAFTGTGQLTLDGNPSSAYVSLPSGITPMLTNATFETWVSNQDTNSDWAELWTFGTNNGVRGYDYIVLVPNNPSTGKLRFEYLGSVDTLFDAPSALPIGTESLVTVTYNYSGQSASIFVNGRIVATSAMTLPLNTIPDSDNYIGRSQWYGSGDPYFNGILDEFRIYNSALSPAQVEADYEAGPNSTSGSPGTLNAIQFNNSANSLVGANFAPSLLATYSSLTNTVDISAVSGVVYSSDNTNIISFGTNGIFHAVAAGSTTIRATYQSVATALVITVNTELVALKHRYSFSGNAGDTAVPDSVGTANGTLMNGTATAAFTGNGQLNLDGNASSAYVSLPSGILPSLTNATFQTWVINNDAFSDWAELWAFGTNNGSQGLNYITLVPNNPSTHKLRFGNQSTSFDAPNSLTLSNESCVTVTYNYSAQLASIYVNGRKVASGAISLPLYSIPDGNNYIGQSEWYGSGDPYFTGSLDEMRIYSGVESDLQIAIDAAAGPNTIVTNPGAISSLSVVVANTNVDIHGVGVTVKVLANFANISGVDITTLSQTTLTSSDTSIGTVVNGNFVPQNVGSSKLTATYGSTSGTVTMVVTDTNAWPTLLHRWKCNDAIGSTTLADSVGTINGTVNGPAAFNGSQLVMPAGNPAPVNGQPTAASGWVSFPANQGLVSGLPNEASFEIWVVWNGNGVWQEMFDFGQAATPGVSSGGGQYVMICPQDGANNVLRAEWDQNPTYDVVLQGTSALPVGVLSQVVWSHDQDRQLDKLYMNGQLVATAVNTGLWSTLPDTDNWMARDQWPDLMFNGAYSDFRIWNGALTSGQVAQLYASGPDKIANPPLQISMTGNQITLQWPANATGFTLQSTANLVNATWTTVSTSPTVVNGLNSVTLPISNSQTFYRLNP